MKPFVLPKPTVLKFECFIFQGLRSIKRVLGWCGQVPSSSLCWSKPLPPLPGSVSLSLSVSWNITCSVGITCIFSLIIHKMQVPVMPYLASYLKWLSLCNTKLHYISHSFLTWSSACPEHTPVWPLLSACLSASLSVCAACIVTTCHYVIRRTVADLRDHFGLYTLLVLEVGYFYVLLTCRPSL